MLTTDTSPTDTGPVFVPLDLGAIPPPNAEARPLLDPILKPGTLTLIRGESGLGKSWLALSVAHAVASGRSVLDWTAPQPARVLYVDDALSPLLLKARVDALGTAPAGRMHVLSTATHGPLPDLGTEQGREALERAMPSGLALLVLDDLTTLLRPGRGQGERLRVFTDWLLSLRRRGLAVLLLDGPRRVATALLDAYADTKLALVRPKDWREEDGARFQIRLTARGFTGAAVRRFEARLDLKDNQAVWTRLAPGDDAEALAVWRLYAGGLNLRAIGRTLGLSAATACRRLARARALPEAQRQHAVPELSPDEAALLARQIDETLKQSPAERRGRRGLAPARPPSPLEGFDPPMLQALLDYLGPAPKEPLAPATGPADLHTPGVRALLADFLAKYRARKARPADPAQSDETLKQPAGAAQGDETVKQAAPADEAMKAETPAPGGATLTLPRPAAAGPALSRERERDVERAASVPPLPLAGSNREAVRRRGEGGADAQVSETVKQAPPPAPARLEDVPEAQLVDVLLSRRRAYQAGRAPEKDALAAFSYQDMFYHARSRLTARGLNKRFAEDDAARQPPAPRRPRGFDVKHIPYPPGY